MKLNTTLSHEAEYLGDVQENRVGIDKNNIDFITTLLTSNLYSRPLDSFFRETIANAYDSHIEAGTDEHILLLIEDTTKYDTYRISIRDYGIGVSPERFDKIYRNIGSSTKRESNDYIGMFGIGRFSCLSCADVANVTSYYKGKKYSYIMYKNGGGINIDLISTLEGDYKDGLEVSIEKTIHYTGDFEKAFEGICLFEKVHITYKGNDSRLRYYVGNFNDRVITHYKNFSRCSLLSNGHNYFKVGNVLYSGVTPKLSTTFGYIVDLPIGSVDITPNRENLQFTDYTKNTIEERVELVRQELQDMANDKANADLSLHEFYSSFADSSYCRIPINDKGDFLLISTADADLDYSKTTIEGEPIPENYSDFLRILKNYEIPKELIYKTLIPSSSNWRNRRGFSTMIRDLITEEYDLMEKSDKVTKEVTLKYVKENLKKRAAILVCGGIPALKSILDKQVQGWMSEASEKNVDDCIDFTFRHLSIKHLANNAIPEDYIKEYREEQKSKRKKTDKTQVPIRIYNKIGYTMEYLNSLASRKGLIIYTTHTTSSEDSIIRDLAELGGYIPGIAGVITIKKEYINLLQADKRYITIENFLFTKNKILSKLATGYIIFTHFMNENASAIAYTPLWKEYRKRYMTEYNIFTYIRSNSVVQDSIKYYMEKNWINQADINYYKFTEKEVAANLEWKRLLSIKEDIIKRLILKKYGLLPKIGLYN